MGAGRADRDHRVHLDHQRRRVGEVADAGRQVDDERVVRPALGGAVADLQRVELDGAGALGQPQEVFNGGRAVVVVILIRRACPHDTDALATAAAGELPRQRGRPYRHPVPHRRHLGVGQPQRGRQRHHRTEGVGLGDRRGHGDDFHTGIATDIEETQVRQLLLQADDDLLAPPRRQADVAAELDGVAESLLGHDQEGADRLPVPPRHRVVQELGHLVREARLVLAQTLGPLAVEHQGEGQRHMVLRVFRRQLDRLAGTGDGLPGVTQRRVGERQVGPAERQMRGGVGRRHQRLQGFLGAAKDLEVPTQIGQAVRLVRVDLQHAAKRGDGAVPVALGRQVGGEVVPRAGHRRVHLEARPDQPQRGRTVAALTRRLGLVEEVGCRRYGLSHARTPPRRSCRPDAARHDPYRGDRR